MSLLYMGNFWLCPPENFTNPHIDFLIKDGIFDEDNNFHSIPKIDTKRQ